jgi:hypothetical protein
MQMFAITPATSRDAVVEPQDVWPDSKDDAASADGGAAAYLGTGQPGRQVKAGDLHPGDILVQFDWSLHVCEVNVGEAAVAIAVTEFGFHLHYAADEQVQLAA